MAATFQGIAGRTAVDDQVGRYLSAFRSSIRTTGVHVPEPIQQKGDMILSKLIGRHLHQHQAMPHTPAMLQVPLGRDPPMWSQRRPTSAPAMEQSAIPSTSTQGQLITWTPCSATSQASFALLPSHTSQSALASAFLLEELVKCT